jgi:hypothetical protein
MSRADINTELLRRVRAGESPDVIRAWGETVNPEDDETGMVSLSFGPELDKVTEMVQKGYGGPVSVLDTTERNAAAPSAARGAIDQLTFNRADQIGAGLSTGFGLLGDYDRALFDARSTRAMDDPLARAAGQLGAAVAPVAGVGLLSKAPGVIGAGARGVSGFYDELLNSGTFLGRVGKASALGASSNILYGSGAADEKPYGVGEVATDATTGAVLGPVAPIAGATVTGVRNFVSPQSGAIAAMVEAGLDPAVLQARIAKQFQDTGRAPGIMDVLTDEEAARFTGALSRSRDARTKVLTGANERMSDLGPGMQAETLNTTPRAPGTALAMPGQTGSTQRAAATPGDIARKTKERGDQDFRAFYNKTAALDEVDRTVLMQNVVSNLTLSGAFKNRFLDALEKNEVTGEMLDILRQLIDKRAASGSPDIAEGGRAMREDFLPILTRAFPESEPAVKRMAAGYSASEGAEAGVRAAKPGTDFIASIDELAKLTPAQVRGTAAGARAALVAEAYGNPRQSYRLATQLASDPSYIDRLGRALGNPQEAEALAAYAAANKNAIDAMFAAARIPIDRVDSTLQNAEGLIDIVAAGTLGGGGAFKAGIANRILAEMKVGEGVANKLADDLMNPARREKVIDLLTKAKIGKSQWRSWIRDSYMNYIGSIANPVVAPEGAVTVEPQ